jgi:uncharacterized protein
MKRAMLSLALLLSLSGMARADELADANALLAKKAYPQALQLFTKLANAGNSEAQLRLGEMYWYGEGVGLDRAKGDALFAQAAAKGLPEAQAATRLSAQRAARMADIAHWSARYDGAELRSGTFECKAPPIPAQSTEQKDIKATTEALNHWSACYNGFVANVAAAMPPGKAIPADVAELMSEAELSQAREHLDKVYARVLADAKKDADATLARRDAWHRATASYAAKTNESVEARTRQAALNKEREDFERNNMRAVGKGNAGQAR